MKNCIVFLKHSFNGCLAGSSESCPFDLTFFPLFFYLNDKRIFVVHLLIEILPLNSFFGCM